MSKTATKIVLDTLRGRIMELREGIKISVDDAKDTERRIKELKKQITDAGKEIEEYESSDKTSNVLRAYRTKLEESLEREREDFNNASEYIRDSKDAIRMFEQLIEFVKEFTGAK